MKRLIQINSVVNFGSTGRIAEDIGLVAMENGWESYIVSGHAYKESKSNLIKVGNNLDHYLHIIKTRLFDLHGFGSKKATEVLIKEIKRVNPDIIALHNVHGYYINIRILFNFLRVFNKPIIWTLYDCWAFTGHCAYFDMANCNKWVDGCYKCPISRSYPSSILKDNSRQNYHLKREIFTDIKNLHIIVHSKWLANKVKSSFLKEYPVQVIHNGVNRSKFKPYLTFNLRKELGIQGKFIILGVSNIWSERKGLSDFIRLSRYLQPDEVIVLIGLNKNQCSDLPENVIGLERTNGVKELSQFYSLGDIFFNPTWEDNFPTTNLEALACGTPIITYNTGGSPEAIDNNTGYVTEKGDIDNVYSCIKEIRRNGKLVYSDKCVDRAKRLFDYKERYDDYIKFFGKWL